MIDSAIARCALTCLIGFQQSVEESFVRGMDDAREVLYAGHGGPFEKSILT
jgi:hypothetical protein